MKEKDGIVEFPEQQVILYVEKEDGNYGPIQTGSYLSGNYLDDYETKRHHLEESLRKQVIEGKISPVHYYMVLEDLTISELAARVRLSRSQVKKHLDPVLFGKASVEMLRRYAAVFNIPPSFLLQMILVSKGGSENSYTILEEKKQTGGIGLADTKNPYVVLVKLGETEE
jgi:hypothetical protein